MDGNNRQYIRIAGVDMMKKESLGDKYKKSIIRINKLEKDKKALIEQITKLSKLSVDQSLMIGERNIIIQKLKEEVSNV